MTDHKHHVKLYDATRQTLFFICTICGKKSYKDRVQFFREWTTTQRCIHTFAGGPRSRRPYWKCIYCGIRKNR